MKPLTQFEKMRANRLKLSDMRRKEIARMQALAIKNMLLQQSQAIERNDLPPVPQLQSYGWYGYAGDAGGPQ